MIILIFILNILFASTFIIAKALLTTASPLFIIGTRMLIAGSILSLYFLYSNKKNIRLNKKDYKTFFLLSLTHIYIPFILEFWALKYTSAAKTSLIYNLSPFVTALLVYIIYNERLSSNKILGLIIGFLGFIPILISNSPAEITFNNFFISLPELCIIIAVISSAYAWITIQNSPLPLLLLNGISMLLGGSLSLCSSLIVENWIPVFNFKYFITLLILIIIIGNFICYNLYAYLLKRYTATFLSFAGFTIPLFTALLQFIFFKTKIGLDFFLTLIIVSFGLYIFYKEELLHGIRKI